MEMHHTLPRECAAQVDQDDNGLTIFNHVSSQTAVVSALVFPHNTILLHTLVANQDILSTWD
jgi:hypothetical protein